MKDQDDNRELDALIQDCLDGQLSEAEAERLSHWIEESSEARQRYWQLASVHGMVEQSLQSASLKAVIENCQSSISLQDQNSKNIPTIIA